MHYLHVCLVTCVKIYLQAHTHTNVTHSSISSHVSPFESKYNTSPSPMYTYSWTYMSMCTCQCAFLRIELVILRLQARYGGQCFESKPESTPFGTPLKRSYLGARKPKDEKNILQILRGHSIELTSGGLLALNIKEPLLPFVLQLVTYKARQIQCMSDHFSYQHRVRTPRLLVACNYTWRDRKRWKSSDFTTLQS